MAAKDHEELQRQLQEQQLQHLLSTKGHEGPRRTTKNGNGNFRNGNCNTFCPRRTQRATENGNCNTFCPRRAAKGREGPRRTATETSGTATATPFVHGGHRGPRRTATATPFVHEGPRRAAKGHEERQRQLQERQLQHLLSTKGREGPRRATKNCNGNFRNSNCNTFCPRRAAKGHEELQRQLQERQLQHLLSTEDTEGHGELQRQLQERQPQHLLSTEDTEGHGGPRRKATATAERQRQHLLSTKDH